MDFAAFFMTFLSDDWVFFQEGEITWDGKRHAINGLQVNAAKVDGFMPFTSENSDFDNIKEALDYFVAFLTNIETDEEFAIPRSSIAPGVAKGLPEGDLTPITFANLAACGSALIVREVGDDDYAVLFDRRLAQGIPCFFNLSARLIWDFRQLTRSGRGAPFKVGFLPTRSIDADACFDESVDVVPGAQDDILVMDVDCAPEISIVAMQSGLRLDTLKACLNTLDPERFAEIEGSPSEITIGNPAESMMEDSELFQALLLQEARAMPRCYAIEGTGYKGRAERVEAMKPGDPVILESDWQCEYFDPVGIEVFNAENQTLGYLSLDLSEGASVVGGFRQLACMLPYVVATVDSVTPVSARGRGAKYPLMDIRVELIDEALDRSAEPVQLTAEAFDACKTMFSLPPEASGACSILRSDGGELEGSADECKECKTAPTMRSAVSLRNCDSDAGLAELTDLYALAHAQDAKEACASLARGISEVPRSLIRVLKAVIEEKEKQEYRTCLESRIAEVRIALREMALEKILDSHQRDSLRKWTSGVERPSEESFISTVECISLAIISRRDTVLGMEISKCRSIEEEKSVARLVGGHFNEVRCDALAAYISALEQWLTSDDMESDALPGWRVFSAIDDSATPGINCFLRYGKHDFVNDVVVPFDLEAMKRGIGLLSDYASCRSSLIHCEEILEKAAADYEKTRTRRREAQDKLEKRERDIKDIETRISNLGLFDFQSKRELRCELNSAKCAVETLRETIDSLDASLDEGDKSNFDPCLLEKRKSKFETRCLELEKAFHDLQASECWKKRGMSCDGNTSCR